MPHILFIDDHELFLEALVLTLGHEYLLSVAPSVPEAFACLALQTPDVVVVDYLMPGLGGLDFLEMVKHLHPRPKVIFISGALTERLERQALQAGAVACLAKPFELDELRRVIERVMWKTGSPLP